MGLVIIGPASLIIRGELVPGHKSGTIALSLFCLENCCEKEPAIFRKQPFKHRRFPAVIILCAVRMYRNRPIETACLILM